MYLLFEIKTVYLAPIRLTEIQVQSPDYTDYTNKDKESDCYRDGCSKIWEQAIH